MNQTAKQLKAFVKDKLELGDKITIHSKGVVTIDRGSAKNGPTYSIEDFITAVDNWFNEHKFEEVDTFEEVASIFTSGSASSVINLYKKLNNDSFRRVSKPGDSLEELFAAFKNDRVYRIKPEYFYE